MASVHSAWAAVMALVGIYHWLLSARRRTQGEFRAFAITCLSLSVWYVGAALATDASSPEAALDANRVQYAGAFTACAFLLEFCARLTSAMSLRIRVAMIVVTVIGLGLDLGGWMWLPGDAEHAAPSLSPVGAVSGAAGLALATWAVVLVALGVKRAPDLVPFVWAAAAVTVLSVVEFAAQALGARRIALLPTVAPVPLLTVSLILQRRFLRTVDAVTARSRELQHRYAELEAAQEELVQKEQLAAVGELSAVIAHEVRNPLAIIKNAVSGLRRPSARASDRRVLLGILDEEVDRLSRLVKNLLAYARPMAPHKDAIGLEALAQQAIDDARGQLDAPNAATFDVDLARVPDVRGDARLLEHALACVFTNSLQAMPSGGTVRVRGREIVHEGQSLVCIEVTDEGEGMDPLVLEKARDPFFTTRAAGTGLGLAIVERVAKNHGGSLEVVSEQGSWTTVRLILPRTGREPTG